MAAVVAAAAAVAVAAMAQPVALGKAQSAEMRMLQLQVVAAAVAAAVAVAAVAVAVAVTAAALPPVGVSNVLETVCRALERMAVGVESDLGWQPAWSLTSDSLIHHRCFRHYLEVVWRHRSFHLMCRSFPVKAMMSRTAATASVRIRPRVLLHPARRSRRLTSRARQRG